MLRKMPQKWRYRWLGRRRTHRPSVVTRWSPWYCRPEQVALDPAFVAEHERRILAHIERVAAEEAGRALPTGGQHTGGTGRIRAALADGPLRLREIARRTGIPGKRAWHLLS